VQILNFESSATQLGLCKMPVREAILPDQIEVVAAKQ
jgi:hypothetical protein